MFGGKGKSLEEQLKEHKEKEKQILKKIEEDRKVTQEKRELEEKLAKEKRELDDKIAKEKELLENEKKLKEQLDKETKIIKDKEMEQQKFAIEQAKKEKGLAIKKEKEEKLKDHPDGCFCLECKELRQDDIKEKLEEGKTRELGVEESKSLIETGYLGGEQKKSKFSFKLPKRTPKPEVLKKDDLNEYHKVKKDPTKLVSFIKNQREKLNKNKQDEIINKTHINLNPNAIDTKVQPTIFTDITVLGIRLAIGFVFIAHGLGKMHEDMVGFLPLLESWGVPTELAFPIALAELVAGILITIGILTRISGAVIGVIMLGAIFVVKGTGALVGQGGIELDIIIIACVALLGIFGPGRLSVSNISIKGMIFDRKLQ